MRKILMGAIIAYLLLVVVLMLNGRIGNVLGAEDIRAEGERLDGKIEEISKLTSVVYPQMSNDLKAAQKNMQGIKQDYEERAVYSSKNEIESAKTLENYNIEFLWTRIGKYATKHGLNLKMEVQKGETDKTKKLLFTVSGNYIPITDFIYSLEDDEQLDFIIENFKIVPENDEGTVLTATFTVADVSINMNNITTIDVENENFENQNSERNEE